MSGFESKVLAELEREDPEEAQAYLEDLEAAQEAADEEDPDLRWQRASEVEIALHEDEELGEFDPFENF
jgi:hypothetical protein